MILPEYGNLVSLANTETSAFLADLSGCAAALPSFSLGPGSNSRPKLQHGESDSHPHSSAPAQSTLLSSGE